MPKTIRRFNKLKHKKEKWMTNELLTQIVRKNKMYVEWKTTPVTSADHEQIKLRFKIMKKKGGTPYKKQKNDILIESSLHINATLKKHG